MKIHVGGGTVYLRDYCNVDLPCEFCWLAQDRPDLVEKYITDESDYYGRKGAFTLDKLREGAVIQPYVCDRYGSFSFIPAPDGTAREILARSVFEHLSLTEGKAALAECRRVLAPDGIIRLDVPDHDESMKKFIETKDEFYIRHILGPRRTHWGYHIASWTPANLCEYVESNGFGYIGHEENIHDYPQFCLRFRKVLNACPLAV
jgi:hypothetical protein